MSAPAGARPAPKARDLAFAVIRDVFGPRPRGAAESLDYHLRKSALDARDRAFATELAYGTIERRRWLDYQLAPYLGARAERLPAVIREILRLGAFQLRALRVHPYAAVAESVALARRFGHPGTAGLVNAVLRRVASEPERPVVDDDFPSKDDALGTRYSLPTWLVRVWRERFGEDRLEAILAGVDVPAPTGLTVDPRRTTREALIERLAAAGIAARPSPLVPSSVVLEGRVPSGELSALVGADAEIQSEAAAVPVDLLAPRPGERILELASGRGNKTLQLALAGGPEATILSVDTDARKVAVARERLAGAGVASVVLDQGDARTLTDRGAVDAVLVDAPCSGIGIVGRQPEARWRKQPDDAERLAPLQAELLAAAADHLAPGGRAVYAVCSTDPRENEAVVEPLIAAGRFVRRPLPARYAALTTAGGDLLIPPGVEGRDGFYVALLERR